MYQIIENPHMMSVEEIDKEFDGKWVYLTRTNYTPQGLLIEAVPVVTGDCPFDGVEDGIYKKFRDGSWGGRTSYSVLLHNPELDIFRKIKS
jgi:hypothetical protein